MVPSRRMACRLFAEQAGRPCWGDAAGFRHRHGIECKCRYRKRASLHARGRAALVRRHVLADELVRIGAAAAEAAPRRVAGARALPCMRRGKPRGTLPHDASFVDDVTVEQVTALALELLLVVRRTPICGFAEAIGRECKAQTAAIAGSIARICNAAIAFERPAKPQIGVRRTTSGLSR